MSTPILLAWSGGKDSTLALERLLDDPQWRVAGLLTTVTSGYERIAIHGVRRSILHAQVAALGLPLIEAEIPPQASNEIYEAAFAGALTRACVRDPDIAHIAFGDLFLADVRAYREAMLARLGWGGVYPLWSEDTSRLARHFIDRGYRAILSCVDTQQLGADFCGREFDASLLAELPTSCDPCGENGEFHTCVYAGPLWRKPLALKRGERVLRDGRFEYVDLLESSIDNASTN
ncbi:MAG: ATP-binding protein [Rudaea sp.]|nr:ATP-binding protein [Rudaea sp.]